MKKITVQSILIGTVIGISIGYLIGLVISIGLARGEVIPYGEVYLVAPKVVARYGNEFNAVLLQTVVTAILGISCLHANLIFKQEHWSLLKQTVIHFFVIIIPVMLASLLLDWSGGHEIYMLVFAVKIYFAIWVINYLHIKKKINKLNQQLKQKHVQT